MNMIEILKSIDWQKPENRIAAETLIADAKFNEYRRKIIMLIFEGAIAE